MAQRGSVVVTGAGSGIGEACALHLDRLGFRVFAGVRCSAQGRALRQRASERLVPLEIEITEPQSITRAAASISRAEGQVALVGLVNCAGIAVFGPLEFLPLEAMRRQLEVNVIGQLAATQAFLPALRRGRGRIVNLGSVSGLVAPPFLGPYSASKFALEALSDALRRELRPWGMPVSVVEAGRIATPIWEKSAADFDDLRARLPTQAEELYGPVLGMLRSSAVRGGGTSAEAVARAVEHALSAPRPRTRYLVGDDARRRQRLRWLPDAIQDWLLTRQLPGPKS